MTKYGIVVGLKEVDAAAYHGFDGKKGCEGCELDAATMNEILIENGFEEKNITTLLSRDATRSAVKKALLKAAETCKRGDIVVFYFSGHGGQAPDLNGDENDNKDETLLCYDDEIIDDELDIILQKFERGVRIVMLSDCCNAGDDYRAFKPRRDINAEKSALKASMVHIGASHEGSSAFGNAKGGFFTRALRSILTKGFRGTYSDLKEAIQSTTKTESPQQAIYREAGPVTSMMYDRFRRGPIFTDEQRIEMTKSGRTMYQPVPAPVSSPPLIRRKKVFGCC